MLIFYAAVRRHEKRAKPPDEEITGRLVGPAKCSDQQGTLNDGFCYLVDSD